MNRVVLNKEEARWFSRNVIKSLTILDAHAKKKPEVKDRTTYKLLQSVSTRAKEIEAALEAFGEEPYEIEMNLSKKQKHHIRSMLDDTHKHLTERVLAEYARRGLQEYVKDTERKLELIQSMVRKFK